MLNAPLAEGWGGQQSRDWAQQTVSEPYAATVQPISTDAGSTEETDRRQLTITSWRMFGGPELLQVLTAESRVRWDGAVGPENPEGELEVDGEVGRFRLRGRDHHVAASLRRVSDA